MLKSLSIILLMLFSFAAQAAAPRTVFVHLFEWRWNDIASECENVLGPKGFSAVQISPPQKSVSGSQWWTRYQPLSYAIEGRSGTRAEFASMVNRCKAAGVGIYVDVVINHMAALSRSFPEVPYGVNDFHTCTTGIDYNNAWTVQNCDLVGLNDLKTESDYVRGKIANYMNDLIGLGVAGFRIDAAKHIAAADVSNIIGRLVGSPYIFQEVIGTSWEAVQASQYTYIGDVTEFNYTNTLGHYFKGRGALKDLSNIGIWGGWLASADAVVFVENHDNQRQNTANIITYKDGANLNSLAHIFMMGWPYGYPEIMSSYDWSNGDQGPPSVSASTCANGWLCEHRTRAIANMVAFSNNTNAAFRVTNYWDNGNNQMAWGRGGLGFVVINREDSIGLNRTFATGMPAGTYCDIIHADFNSTTKTCSGATVVVNSVGNATISVNTHDAVAIHVGAVVAANTVTKYRITNRWKNTVLCDAGDYVSYNTTSSGAVCQWTTENVGSGFIEIRNQATGDYMHIENLTGKIQATARTPGWDSSKWQLESVDGTYSRVKNKWQSTQYIHVENQTGAAQHGTINSGWLSAQWKFEVVL